ncbi:MAG: gliding motility-associated ABC transporter ATP-binding subunit GldA [Saprospiraceae bacterium]|nr:gliding motility-associated ABC transporter ATP-binding subunit GldA [Saprospiraceae bacterium]
MSVIIQHITKSFGTQKAVNDVSFTANPSEILGFLGPNGAGKTTTMKVITGFYKADSGNVQVCGIDIDQSPLESRRLIGYLPEHNPLYKDMYVREYLLTFARLNQISNPNARVEEMIELTGLTKEQNKLIGTLSKGYRQRVGLSQALLHNPKVLILDEPTSGLDPNQIQEIRDLIRSISKEKTIIFSTHIMQEVKTLCDRVVIINNGKIVADDPISKLQSRFANKQLVIIEFRNDPELQNLKLIRNIDQIHSMGKAKYSFSSSIQEDLRDYLSDECQKNNWQIREIHKEKNSVEEVFSRLTSSKE